MITWESGRGGGDGRCSHQPHVCDPELGTHLLAGFFFSYLSAAGLRISATYVLPLPLQTITVRLRGKVLIARAILQALMRMPRDVPWTCALDSPVNTGHMNFTATGPSSRHSHNYSKRTLGGLKSATQPHRRQLSAKLVVGFRR